MLPAVANVVAALQCAPTANVCASRMGKAHTFCEAAHFNTFYEVTD